NIFLAARYLAGFCILQNILIQKGFYALLIVLYRHYAAQIVIVNFQHNQYTNYHPFYFLIHVNVYSRIYYFMTFYGMPPLRSYCVLISMIGQYFFTYLLYIYV